MIAPATFTWKKPGGVLCRGEGVTRDISVSGAYVFSGTCPPVRARVQMEIRLPRLSLRPGPLVKGKMRTQRIERDLSGKTESGFSVTGKGFALRLVSRLRPTIMKPRALKKKRG
jgi:hypothetical protein